MVKLFSTEKLNKSSSWLRDDVWTIAAYDMMIVLTSHDYSLTWRESRSVALKGQ